MVQQKSDVSVSQEFAPRDDEMPKSINAGLENLPAKSASTALLGSDTDITQPNEYFERTMTRQQIADAILNTSMMTSGKSNLPGRRKSSMFNSNNSNTQDGLNGDPN